MESITFEICTSPSDPLDRTLGVMARSGHELVAARSYRLADHVPLGTVLLWIDRIVLNHAHPGLDEWKSFYDVLDEAGYELTSPF